jgi:hypothetical protein
MMLYWIIHTNLYICGMEQTILRPVCDRTNAVLYLISGDLSNAALSASTSVPIAGYGGGLLKTMPDKSEIYATLASLKWA